MPATNSGLKWQVSAGIYLFRVAGFKRNHWQVWTGIFIFSNDKEYLKQLRTEIQQFLCSELKLELKKEAECLNAAVVGLPFLGRRIYRNFITLKKENFTRSFKKLKLRSKQFETKKISYKKYVSALQSIISYLCFYSNALLKSRLVKGKML
jgi:hypothetical protein